METNKFDNIEELFSQLSRYRGIHIECNQEQSEAILQYIVKQHPGENRAFLTVLDKGYERQKVIDYLRFFRALHGCDRNLESVLEEFGLTEIKKQKMQRLKPGEYTKIGIARASMQDAEFYFLEEPLLNLTEEDMKRVLNWIEERCAKGVTFVTTNSSLRHASILPGAAFYLEDGRFCEVERDEEADEAEEEPEVEILKIPVKSGNSTLLFEPKDIDYIESLNKCVYVAVRGTLFQTQKTMYELEEVLKKAGFFRCHRSYLVNIQKVERLDKWTKNSFVLILNNAEGSQIPLSKGRIEEMKQVFQW